MKYFEAKIGYKVVNKKNLSASTPDPEAVHYRLRKWTLPKKGCGPLAVFIKRSYAMHYISHEQAPPKSFRIYCCIYIPSNQPGLHLRNDFASKNYYETPRSILPKGTDLASAVLLIKRCHI